MNSKEMRDTAKEAFQAAGGDSIVAAALIQLEGLDAIAKALDRLGLNYTSEAGPPGAVEGLAMHLKEAIDGHTVAVASVADAIGRIES